MYKQGRDRLHAPSPGAQADGHRRPARPQDRPRLLHLRGAELAGRRARRAHAGRRSTPARCATRPVQPSASSARARWRPASSRSSPRPASTCCYVARGDDKVAKVRSASSARSTRRVAARQADARPTATPRSPGSPGRRRLDDMADRDLVVEAVVEDLAVKTVLFETLDEICKPGAILATTTSSLPVVDLAAATKRPQDVVGLHFFNPAPVMKLVEVVVDRGHRRRRRRDGGRRVPPARQAPGHVRRPRRLHRQRAAVPLPQRRRARCSRPTTPRPTTSTPR